MTPSLVIEDFNVVEQLRGVAPDICPLRQF
jgi:hypothetical protein